MTDAIAVIGLVMEIFVLLVTVVATTAVIAIIRFAMEVFATGVAATTDAAAGVGIAIDMDATNAAAHAAIAMIHLATETVSGAYAVVATKGATTRKVIAKRTIARARATTAGGHAATT